MIPFTAVVFDLDGTIYNGNALIEGAHELVLSLKEKGVNIYYCSNNSSQTRNKVCEKLNKMGLSVTSNDVITAGYATAHYVAEENIRNVFCFGSIGLRHELQACGSNIVAEPELASAVIIGLDPSLDYRRISQLMTLRGKQCRLIACNRDKFFPSEDGNMQPGCGYIVDLVELLLERKVDYIVGKPSDYLLKMLMNTNGLTAENLIMIGDSLESDIGMANTLGCKSILISKNSTIPAHITRASSLHEVKAYLGTLTS
jgi:HAD superfamily hydrolase (TIGR01450 family)